ncbi:MAG: hypothetical protein ABIP07_01330 [Sphingomicrobium sp.]
MRRFIATAAVLLLAACATTPAPQPVAPVRPVEVKPQRGDLIGLTANELGARFGQPRIQVREGDGTKLQFATKSCILDAYLYPPSGGKGVVRVTHVDARTRDGRDTDQARCITAIEER